MKINNFLLAAFTVFVLAACTSAKDRKDEAEAEYTEEKTQTLQEYKKCVSDSDGDESKLAQCDALLKAVSATEGGTVNDAVEPATTPVATPAPASTN
jgi:hypothetical protein